MAKFNEYPAKTIPKDADKFMLYSAEDSANKLIDYDKLADAVLNKLTSKQFTLDQGSKTLLSALNELNSKALKPIYKGVITNSLTTVQMAAGFYFVTTYRSGGYKLSSLSLVNIQIQNGSFIETLVKGEDYDTTINMNCTEENISFKYKIKLTGECTINIFKLVGAS